VASALAAASLLAACQRGSAQDSGQSTPTVVLQRLNADPLAFFTERTEASFSVLAIAETTLLNYCLSTAGYPVQPLPTRSRNDKPDDGKLTLDVAERYGYGLPPGQAGSGNAQLVGEPPLAVLWGDKKNPIQGVPSDGCYGYARRSMFGGQYDKYESSRLAVEKMRNDAVKRMLTDPREVTTLVLWSRCFEGLGYKYKSPQAAREAGSLLAIDRQIAMAVADVRCRQQTGLDDLRDQIVWNYERESLENEPTAYASFSSLWTSTLRASEGFVSGHSLPQLTDP